MAANYIALDSGGTKLSALLFDDSFHVLARYRGAGVNTNSRSADEVERTIAQCMAALLGDGKVSRVDSILGWFMFSADSFLREARSYAECREIRVLSEGLMGACACGVTSDAVTVLSGTGSGAFYLSGGETVDWAGGWGALLGDEGSGFAVGRELLRMAIFAQEAGETPPVIGALCRRYGESSLRRATDKIYAKPSAASEIASLSRLAAELDAGGDPLCRGIMRQAGAELGRQALWIYRRNQLSPEVPLCLAGGLLLSSGEMRAGLQTYLEDAGLSPVIYEPELSPEEGVAAYVFNQKKGGLSREDYRLLAERLHTLSVQQATRF